MKIIYENRGVKNCMKDHRTYRRNFCNDLFPVDLLDQLVQRCTGIAEVMGSNPVQAWIFSGFLFATANEMGLPWSNGFMPNKHE